VMMNSRKSLIDQRLKLVGTLTFSLLSRMYLSVPIKVHDWLSARGFCDMPSGVPSCYP
jgi:hypothetical protein